MRENASTDALWSDALQDSHAKPASAFHKSDIVEDPSARTVKSVKTANALPKHPHVLWFCVPQVQHAKTANASKSHKSSLLENTPLTSETTEIWESNSTQKESRSSTDVMFMEPATKPSLIPPLLLECSSAPKWLVNSIKTACMSKLWLAQWLGQRWRTKSSSETKMVKFPSFWLSMSLLQFLLQVNTQQALRRFQIRS